jgi:hypothetical protein
MKGAHQQRKEEASPAWVGLTPVPDWAFERKLKRFDPSLSIEFSRRHGKFVIYQQGRISGKTPALIVGGREQCFRQPDDRDIERLRLVDLHNETIRKRILQGHEQDMLEARAKDEKTARDTLREAGIDDRHYLKREMRKAINDGKTASHVAPRSPRPRGKVFK